MQEYNHYHNYLNLSPEERAEVREHLKDAYRIIFNVHPEECTYTSPMSDVYRALHNMECFDIHMPMVDKARKLTGCKEVVTFTFPCDIWGKWDKDSPFEVVLCGDSGLWRCTYMDIDKEIKCEQIELNSKGQDGCNTFI